MEKLQKIGKFFKNWKIGKFEKLAKKNIRRIYRGERNTVDQC